MVVLVYDKNFKLYDRYDDVLYVRYGKFNEFVIIQPDIIPSIRQSRYDASFTLEIISKQ